MARLWGWFRRYFRADDRSEQRRVETDARETQVDRQAREVAAMRPRTESLIEQLQQIRRENGFAQKFRTIPGRGGA